MVTDEIVGARTGPRSRFDRSKNTTLNPIAVEVFGGRMRMFGRTSQDQTEIEKAKEWAREIAKHFLS